MRCEECKVEATGQAKGWIAIRIPGLLVIYCPTCARREFGDRYSSRRDSHRDLGE